MYVALCGGVLSLGGMDYIIIMWSWRILIENSKRPSEMWSGGDIILSLVKFSSDVHGIFNSISPFLTRNSAECNQNLLPYYYQCGIEIEGYQSPFTSGTHLKHPLLSCHIV